MELSSNLFIYNIREVDLFFQTRTFKRRMGFSKMPKPTKVTFSKIDTIFINMFCSAHNKLKSIDVVDNIVRIREVREGKKIQVLSTRYPFNMKLVRISHFSL